jgi:hypothetical protein
MAEKIKVATPEILGEFLTGCRDLFASQNVVNQNNVDINDYVLDVSDWYDNNLAFDTNEIVVDSEIV